MPPREGLPVWWPGALPVSSDLVPFGPSARVPTRLNRQLGRVEQRAAVNARTVQSVAFVTAVAMQSVTQLSITQSECAKVAPGAELRLAALVDAATASIQGVILQQGLDW